MIGEAGTDYTEPMDELDVAGKKYISSKRASELTGYAKDYIGQLARAGKIPGTRFGRAWYVEETALMQHLGGDAAPIASEPPVSPISEVTPALRKPQGSLLTHHMITPAVLPKTWSNIQYLEDTSDLYPELKSKSVLSHSDTRETTPETLIPVTVIRTQAAVEKRVALLVDGIRPRSPMLRVAQSAVPVRQIPQEVVPMQGHITSVKSIPKPNQKTVQKNVQVHWSAGSFATAFAAFVLVFGSFASFFVIKNMSTGNVEGMTASTFYGVSDVLQVLKDARLLDGGIQAISSFYYLLKESFFVFAKSGADFVINLF